MEYKSIYDDLEIGDIIIVSSTNQNLSKKKQLVSWMNYSGQKVAYKMFQESSNFIFSDDYNHFKYTHVILGLSNGIFMESVKGAGVKVFSLNELIKLFDSDYSNDFRVIRHLNLDEKMKEKIFKAAEFHYQESYNINILKSKKRFGYAYCSEFIANVFGKVDIPLNSQYRTYPIDILNLLNDSSRWDEVTNLYKKVFEDKHCREFGELLIYSFLKLHQQNDLSRMISKFTNRYSYSQISFYDSLYKKDFSNLDKTIESTSMENNFDIELDEILEKAETTIGTLEILQLNIKSVIKELEEQKDLTSEQLNTTWKQTETLEDIHSKTNQKVYEINEVLNIYSKINGLWNQILTIDDSDNIIHTDEYKKVLENIERVNPILSDLSSKFKNIRDFILELSAIQKTIPKSEPLFDCLTRYSNLFYLLCNNYTIRLDNK
jgi:hypothetical protein